MKISIFQKNTVRAIALMAGLSLVTSSKATVPTSDLPDFDNLGNFGELGNQLDDSGVTVNGNVGVSSGGTLSMSSVSTINGDVYVGPGASFSGPSKVVGSIFTDQNLSIEQATVFSASQALSMLTPDVVISGNQTTSLSYDVPAGQVQVVNLNGGLNLGSGQTITLTGDGDLVLNIMGSFSLSGPTAEISGPNPSNVFINYLGTSAFDATGSPVINGEVFIPDAGADLSGATLNGSLFSGNSDVVLMSESTINATPVAEPDVSVLAGFGGISIILLFRRKAFGFIKTPPSLHTSPRAYLTRFSRGK